MHRLENSSEFSSVSSKQWEWISAHVVLKWGLVCFGFVWGGVFSEFLQNLHLTHPKYAVYIIVHVFLFLRLHITDRLQLLAKLLVEVRGFLQSGLEGGDLLLFNLQS